MTERQLRELLGPVGAEALTVARRELVAQRRDVEDIELSWAGWTATEWNFTFRQRTPAVRYALHVPHDGSGVALRMLGPSDRPGAGPLAD